MYKSFLEQKEEFFKTATIKQKKKWYKKNYPNLHSKHLCYPLEHFLLKRKINLKSLNFIRWVLVDFLRGKVRKFFGIYLYVALPGEGKTMSMVAHMERVRERYGKKVYFATNFNYKYQDRKIEHWLDIVETSKYCTKNNLKCVIAIDEIHTTFDSSDWQSFPPELLSLLSFNRKVQLQFICSSQIYDRVPKKIRDITNYVVICKNIFGRDRLFRNYYFEKNNYDTDFTGKRKKASFIREFVADDKFHGLYNTLEQVDKLTEDAKKEKGKRQQAFELLFGREERQEEK